MKIKEACLLTGLTEKTLRYYEDCGLICPSKDYRNGRYWRDYSQHDISILNAVSTLRKARFSVSQIYSMLEAPECIQDVLTEYKTQILLESKELDTLARTLPNLGNPKSILELSTTLKPITHGINIPQRDIVLNFGKYDNISNADREREYIKHSELQKRKNRNIDRIKKYLTVSLLCFLFLITIVLISSLLFSKDSEPIYWSQYSQESGRAGIFVSDSNFSETELIYSGQTSHSLSQLTVQESRLYFIENGKAMSVDPGNPSDIKTHYESLDDPVDQNSKLTPIGDRNGLYFKTISGKLMYSSSNLEKPLLVAADCGDDYLVHTGYLWYVSNAKELTCIELGTMTATNFGTIESDYQYCENNEGTGITCFQVNNKSKLYPGKLFEQDANFLNSLSIVDNMPFYYLSNKAREAFVFISETGDINYLDILTGENHVLENPLNFSDITYFWVFDYNVVCIDSLNRTFAIEYPKVKS